MRNLSNALETVVNLAPLLDLRIFSSSKPSFIKITISCSKNKGKEPPLVENFLTELIGRLIINSDNEPFILSFGPQIYKRLVYILSLPAVDAQANAVGALYNLAEVNMDCRLKLASE
ncbi:hypothetical protein HYC85_029472 [Camellia sinensis]|uniref:Armadillo repeat-containing domain-containing protein n=1 Tax=Camellia sinensis TaxID=4442 RepID=A0A7J7FZD8_CAMSI|nr:hypothetical protein HYC85_029472 [Camellia sinensis]